MADRTILDLYRYEVDAPRPVHYLHHFPGGSRSFSTEEFFRRTSGLAAGLERLGVARGDRVALLAENRPEWHMADLAVLSLGAIDVPLYPTLTAKQIAYQLNDSGAVAAIVENGAQMEKFLEVRRECPNLRHLVQIEGGGAKDVLPLHEVIAIGHGADAGERFWARAATIDPDATATIVYTSGTTGEPKGAILTHRNFVANVEGTAPMMDAGRDDVAMEFLPLCHVFERCAGYVYMRFQCTHAYCATQQVGELIAAIKPTIFCCVPRVFEKVHERVLARAEAAPPARRRLFYWAVDVGRRAAAHRLAGTAMPAPLRFQHAVADRIVLSKVRDALGGRVRVALSGAAPLPKHVNEFFHALGVSVQEGYGLTETSPVISANGPGPGENRLGTVGRPLANVEVTLASDGELLVRGPSVFEGYWNKPEQTAEVFDEDGFFHTGDIAAIDQDGFISITDRKKEIIVTAGGKNVAPQPIENRLRQSRFVETAVLVGDRRPYIVALLAPNLDELTRWSREQGLPDLPPEELVRRPEVLDLFEGIATEANQELARFEQIKAVRVLPAPFSVEDGRLTPTLKVKRRVVETMHRPLIEEMYAGAAAGVEA
jgi:long-chain acyl-CoA synthetase